MIVTIAVMVTVMITIVVMVAVMSNIAATVASLLKLPPAVLHLTAVLTVLSHFFVKIVFSLLNTFVAVAPMVCL
jgi:hypothetical protein